MCFGLTQFIIVPLYKINRKYNVMKCQHMVLLLCFFFVGSRNTIIIMIKMMCVCVSIQYS
jgi:hypothetical protein